MSLDPGTRLGPYEVLGAIDSGVAEPSARYKASDTRVNRVVSLQVLPPELSTPEMKARLESDARTISSLNHPNICALVDVGHHEPSTDFVVAEFVEGDTLAERLKRGPLPIAEAIAIAIAIADSLDKAHRKGIVHGGLNPATVLLTAGGPKLLDFGVARLKEESHAPVASSIAATRTSLPSLSAAPAFTARYLAPELFAGAQADARSDIFAVGTILYEMIAGRPAFQEKTLALLMAAIQSVEPDPISKLQPATPPALDHIIKRCLSKNPHQRLQTAWDLMTQLRWVAEGGSQIGIPVPATGRRNQDWVVWAAVAAVSMLAAGLAPSAAARFHAAPEPMVARFFAPSVPSIGATPVLISPDGRWVIASAGGTGAPGISGVRLNAVTAQLLIKQNILYQPFWSADSQWIAFFDDGKLKKGDVSGGPPQIICDAPPPIGTGTWKREGVILFSGAGLIQRVLAAGGQPAAVTELDKSKQETEHLAPSFLPDGRHYLFLAVGAESAIYVGSLDSKERKRLLVSDSRAIYASGYVLFNRGNAVFAQPFDTNKLSLTGEPIRVADGVPLGLTSPYSNPSIGRFASFSASQTGVLVFRTSPNATDQAAGAGESRSFSFYDRGGARGPSLGVPGPYAGVDLSPDGKRFVVHRHDGAGGDNWVYTMADGRTQRLTFDATQDNQSPVWSPDGMRIAFSSRRNDKWGIYTKLADGTGTEDLITASEALKVPMSWSPDGKLLVYSQIGLGGDVWAVPVTGDRKPFALLQTQFNERFPQVSPDGKWLAYTSNETQRDEIYVKPFPDGPGKWQVSVDGGLMPRWRHDSRELYFISAPNIMAADIRVTGSSFEAGVPQALFPLGATPNAAVNHNSYSSYAVASDGRSFLLSQPGLAPAGSGGLADQIANIVDRGGATATAPNTVTVVLNWPQMLSKK